MATAGIDSIAGAEKILNRTLAYQAAIAVHELKDRLDLDVAEIRLVVAPLVSDAPGSYRVTCTIANLVLPAPVSVEVIVRPDQATASAEENRKAEAGRPQAEPAPRGRRRRPRN
jgi:hypothetical protein